MKKRKKDCSHEKKVTKRRGLFKMQSVIVWCGLALACVLERASGFAVVPHGAVLRRGAVERRSGAVALNCNGMLDKAVQSAASAAAKSLNSIPLPTSPRLKDVVSGEVCAVWACHVWCRVRGCACSSSPRFCDWSVSTSDWVGVSVSGSRQLGTLRPVSARGPQAFCRSAWQDCRPYRQGLQSPPPDPTHTPPPSSLPLSCLSI